MAGEGSSSAGKRFAYHDLDAFEWDDAPPIAPELPTPSSTQTGPSSTSEGKKKKKKHKSSTHERNPDYLPKEYGHFVQEVALDFYNTKTPYALERQFMAHGAAGLMSLQAELVEVISKALKRSEVYNNFDNYWELGKWMDQQIISNTSNVLHSFECAFKKGEDGQWNSKDRALQKKLAKIQAFVGRHSNTKTKIVPWRVQAMKAAMQYHMGGGIVYLLEKALVVAVPGFGNEGGYGEICKVRISRVASIPTIVDFAGKMSKAVNKVDKQVEMAKEAVACLIEYPGLIKF
jgi:hypothetical protein